MTTTITRDLTKNLDAERTRDAGLAVALTSALVLFVSAFAYATPELSVFGAAGLVVTLIGLFVAMRLNSSANRKAKAAAL